MRFPRLTLAASAGTTLILALIGCSSNESAGDFSANTTIATKAAPGASSAYLVGDPDGGAYAESFLDANGDGFMLAYADDAKAPVAYYRVRGGVAERMPRPASPITVSIAASSAVSLPTTALTLANAAGTYRTLVNGTQALLITIDSAGNLMGSGSGCGVTGTLNEKSVVAGAIGVTLNLTGCPIPNGQYQGFALRSPTLAPAVIKLVGQNGINSIDWLLL
jgi:hypothetical protein